MGEREAGHDFHRVCWPLATHFGRLTFGAPLEPQRYMFPGPSSRLADVCHLQICCSLPDYFVNLARKSVFPQPLRVSTPPPATPYAPATTWFPNRCPFKIPGRRVQSAARTRRHLVQTGQLPPAPTFIRHPRSLSRGVCPRARGSLRCSHLEFNHKGLWTGELYGVSIRLCFPSPP